MFLYVSPQDSVDYYPLNTVRDFTVELPKAIDTTGYQLALTHVYFKGQLTDNCLVFCDAVEPSIIRARKDNVLGSFFQPGAVDSPQYHDLIWGSVKRLRFKIEGDSLPSAATLLVLHLRGKQE